MLRFVTIVVTFLSLSASAGDFLPQDGMLHYGNFAGGYGAIAYSPVTGRFGTSWNWDSSWQAERVAMSYCYGWDCRVVVRVLNSCAALAVSHYSTYQYGWGWASNSLFAANNALAHCVGPCYVKAGICSR